MFGLVGLVLLITMGFWFIHYMAIEVFRAKDGGELDKWLRSMMSIGFTAAFVGTLLTFTIAAIAAFTS